MFTSWKSFVVRLTCLAAMLLLSAELLSEATERTRPKRWIESVHEPIAVANLDKSKIRLGILNGMYHTRGYSWQLEGETANSIIARFDYRQGTIVFKIVHDESTVRLHFLDGNNGYECDNLRDGICHYNSRKYYNYSKNLRASIEAELKKVGSGE